jgi:hypothetical protein
MNIMKTLVGLVALLFTTSAFAQSAQPKAAAKPPAHAKPQAPAGCKLVGTVKGTKLWAGDCIDAAGLRSSDPAAPPEQPGDAIRPGEKQ